ncbi:hypothetical protein Z517_04461 [Fonsecaea pedrosoi CBS 271.37]|uniref:Unplaced genomic scaffold supercont1.3, whole genome shotgun sequence n=1 Tax=Fonsecaea pedrosoi CBS 271.37 TaxID=1442368 RepID=A0A0D2DUJ3_9EURO|nr:uncharacterized protein Z517_04461 [Fonsecaea pedrosoi CBS 271.37]KIW81436.1 hypothetical protein Z517_04461 [Fonsecaea pedrosoi CBS 271.37]
MGPSSEFCVYHLMHKTDPLELFPVRVYTVEGYNSFVRKEVSGSEQKEEKIGGDVPKFPNHIKLV